MKALKKTKVPVPEVYILCQDESIIGSVFYVMEYLKGRIFVDPALPSLSPDERTKWFTFFFSEIRNHLNNLIHSYQSVIETLTELHNLNWRELGLQNFGKAGNYYSRNVKNLTKLSREQG